MASYNYTPLSPGTDQIRLLTLLPANDQNEGIAVYLQPIPTKAARGQYEALSYVWGSPDNPETISVIASSRTDSEKDGVSSSEYNAAPLPVTRNLAIALRHLRGRAAARTLWIDAICIDQQNIAEKSEQVGKMAQIYKSSARVLLWLGPKSFESDKAMQIVDHLGQVLHFDRATEAFTLTSEGADEPYLSDFTQPLPDQEPFLRAIETLFWSPWFERLWVIQEVLLSPDAVVVCGRQETSWQSLLLACSFLLRRTRYTKTTIRAKTVNRLWKIEAVFKQSPGSMLLDLVQMTHWLKCADDRDRIYAVLSLAVDARQIKPDYSLSTIQVYQELVMVSMKQHRTLKFLKFCESGSRRLAGPSWIPDWTGWALAANTRTTHIIDHGVASFAWHRVIQPAEGCIRVTAARVGTVVDVDVVSFPPDATLSAVRREIARLVPADIDSSTYKTGCSLMEAFSGGLLQTSFKRCVPMPSEPVATVYFLTPQQGADALRSCLPCQDGPGRPVDRNFLNQAYQKTKDKALVKTEEGHIGMAPSYVKEGDTILAILSCSTLTIVRPAPGNEGRYQVVGNSFMYGFNNNEAVLGPLPEHIHGESHYHPAYGRRISAYRDTKTDQVSWIDPRYEALGISFSLNEHGIPKRISPEELEKVGIRVSQIDLV